ncbi:MAG: hypothetical protein ACT4NL_02315 [Pseudomarimonas sp.]
MILENAISFHESSFVGVESEHGLIRISVEDAVQADGSRASGTIMLTGVSRIYADEALTSVFEMESSDGEIIDLEWKDKELSLIVQWNDFSNRTSITRHYRVVCESVDWVRQRDEAV